MAVVDLNPYERRWVRAAIRRGLPPSDRVANLMFFRWGVYLARVPFKTQRDAVMVMRMRRG